MLKITIHDSASECRFTLEGHLAGNWVYELEMCWHTARSAITGRKTTLDLRRIESADQNGQALLEEMFRNGATLAVEPERLAAQPRSTAPRLVSRLCAMLALLLCPALAFASSEPPEAHAALERFLSRPAELRSDSAVRLEIRARLPKYGRSGVSRAVESIPDSGRPVFQVTAFEGDDMVKRQVIARYMAAEAEGRRKPEGSLSLNSANYRFRFLRGDTLAGVKAWVFRVQPRKKRTGLFAGELWIDAAGHPLRQSGRFVKNPSIFVKRIEFVRDFDPQGAPRSLALHLLTRIAGPAELTVAYRPVEADAALADAAGSF